MILVEFNTFVINIKIEDMFGDLMGMMGKLQEAQKKVEETKQIVNDTKAKVEEAVKQEKVEDIKKEEELKSSLDKLKEEVINDKK